MNSYLSQLNPAERRFVIIVALVFFVVINVFFIWPHFGDLGAYQQRLQKARSEFAKREQVIQQKTTLERDIRALTSEGGNVPAEDAAIQFLRTIQVQAAQSGVGFQGSSRTSTSTNQFFLEQLQTVRVISPESNLIDFLYNLGSGNSMIRVREISVRPDQSRQQLDANITLVASYQKTARPAATKAAPTAAPATARTVTPAAATATRTNSPAQSPSKLPTPPKK
jgi:General secretion pathway, M protein.